MAGTILGCPVSAFIALESVCAVTNVPACATATPSTAWDAGCCSSLYTYGTSVGSCYLKNAPTCLDTKAAASTLAAATGGSDVCAQYFGAGGGVTAATSVKVTATPAATGGAGASSGITAAGSAASGAASGASSAASSAAAATTAKSAAPKMSVGLKVYIGAALISALAVLSL